MNARTRFFSALGVLLSILVLGTLGYMVIEGASPLDAAYMTVITVSTVGFRETVAPATPLGQAFTMLVIMVGVGSVSFATVSLITLLVSGELQAIVSVSKEQKRVQKLSDHIIVCGFGRMGRLVASQLTDRQRDILIIDVNPERISQAQQEGLLTLRGDASEESTLVDARISHACTLVATLPRDSDNVYVTLTARGLCPHLVIIARAEITATEEKLRRAGADRVVCPQVIGANRISSLVTRPNVVDFVDVASQNAEFEIDEFQVQESSSLVGQSLRDSALRRDINAIVVAIKPGEGDTIFNPPADHVIERGDTLIIVGKPNTSSLLSQL
jgi:voltage-gated potassium channel